MIERDYIMRLFYQFFEELALLLNKKKKEEKISIIQKMFDTYFKDPNFYIQNDPVDILRSFDEMATTEKLCRIEMLAELLHQEALLKEGEEKYSLLDKSLKLYGYVNDNSTTFSFDRLRRMKEINDEIK
jgi:hypothetical protein